MATRVAAPVLGAALLAACAAGEGRPVDPQAATACVSGIVAYREAVVLTSEARLDLRVVDLGRGMAAVETLAKVEGRIGGPLPRPFRICYDPAALGMAAKPALRAWIQDRQATLFYKWAAVLLPPGKSIDDVYLVLDALGSEGAGVR